MEDPFDRSVRERMEKASFDPSPDVWDRINRNIAPPRKGHPVWVRLAAGLLVAGIAAGYFMQHEQSPEQVAEVIMAAPVTEPDVAPATEPVKRSVPAERRVAQETPVEEVSGQQEVITVDAAEPAETNIPESVDHKTLALEPGSFDRVQEVDGDASTDHEGFQTLVYELPIEIAHEPVAVYATTDRKIDRFTRLIRELKNGEVSLGQVREFKDGLFTRSFWKEKLSKNTNQIMQ